MQIIYFPYLHLGNLDEINFGNIKVWNFERKATDYISDEKLREYIRSLLYSNFAHNQSIKDMGVLSIGAIDFREFTPQEREITNEVRLMLFLAFLSKNNTLQRSANAGWRLGTSENFELVIQNFQPYTEHIAQQSGYIVPILSGGYKINEYKFYKPHHVPSFTRFNLDNSLIKYLLQLKKSGGKKLYVRILRATDLLFESYYNNPNVSKNARVLLQIAAFEILLDLDDRSQRKDFKEKISKYCDLPNEKQYKYFYETRGGKRLEQGSKKVVWADTYYTLRNHIIHGDTVKTKDFVFRKVQHHIDIAILFFILLVKKLIKEKQKSEIFYDEITWNKTRDGDDLYEGFIYNDNDLIGKLSRYFK